MHPIETLPHDVNDLNFKNWRDQSYEFVKKYVYKDMGGKKVQKLT